MIYLTSMLVPPLLQAVILFSISFLIDKLALCVTESIEKTSRGTACSSNYQATTIRSRRRYHANKYRKN